MENLDNSKSAQNVLEDYVKQLKAQRNIFIICRVILMILLCGLLVLVFLLFCFNFNLFPNGHFCLNDESSRLLWIAVAMDIFGLLWMLVKSGLQLKQYRKDIRRLEMLSLRVKIQSKGTEEEICEVLRSYYGTRCESRTHNESNTTDKH